MSELCQKCGATLSPGLCGICEREELRAEVERLNAALVRAVEHGTDEESQKWAAIQERDEARALLERVRKMAEDAKDYGEDLSSRDVIAVLEGKL